MEITYEGSPRKQIKSWLLIDWWTVKQMMQAINHRGQAKQQTTEDRQQQAGAC